MSRRGSVAKRLVLPDPVYGNVLVSRLMHVVMLKGKKSVAEKIVYGALKIAAKNTSTEEVEVFLQALANASPSVEVRSRRIGGATYQVPVGISETRKVALALRALVRCARKRSESTMEKRLGAELTDAFNKRGGAVKKREETEKMAEANKAFSHFRW